MKQFDELGNALSALLETLGPEERAQYEAHIARVAASIHRLEEENALLRRERSAIHALLKKTSEDLIRRYQTLFENSGTAMAVIEDDGTISLVNTVFEQISGYPRSEVEHHRTVFSIVVPEERERIMAYHRERRHENLAVPHDYETRVIRRDGRIIDVVVSAQLFPGTLQSIASFMDITERKRSENALRLAHTKLNILSGFTRHDILNQLTVLSGYLELSRDLITEPRLLEYFRKEKEVTDKITHLISFTKDYQEIGIHSAVWQDLERTIVRATRTINRGEVRLRVEMDNVEIYADPLIERVFYNLLENALLHAGNLTEIRFSFIRSGTSGLIVCEDDGCGVPAGEKENIFLRKYYQHTGLGMYLSREILSMTGITIRETGEPGRGARFEIVVPEGNYRFRGNK
jgi:PAS domain S-box-containing protein